MIAANRWWSSFFSKNKIIILYAKYQFSYFKWGCSFLILLAKLVNGN